MRSNDFSTKYLSTIFLLSTLSIMSTNRCNPTLHYTTVHYSILQYTTLLYITLNYSTLLYIRAHYTTVHYSILHYTTVHYSILHYTTVRRPSWNDPMTAVVQRVKGFAYYSLSFSRHNKNIKMEHFFLYILSRYFI